LEEFYDDDDAKKCAEFARFIHGFEMSKVITNYLPDTGYDMQQFDMAFRNNEEERIF
jgi:hypothetical protein